MYFDSITLLEGSQVFNLSVATGTELPTIAPNTGELFYLTVAPEGLYVYHEDAWAKIGEDGGLATHIADETLHLTSTQNSFLDALTVSSTEVNYLSGVTSSVQDQFTGKASLSGGATFTAGAISLPDTTSIGEVTSTEISYLDGVTSSIQTQLNAIDNKVDKDGSTMTSTANLVFVGGGTVTGLPEPTDDTDAASKSYVDSFVTGLVWSNPVSLSNLIGTSTTVPGAPLNADAYIIGTGGDTGLWGGFSVGDIVQWLSATSTWTLVRAAAVGDRFGISFHTVTAGTGDAAGKDDYIGEITGGTAGAWVWTWAAPVVGHAVFVNTPEAFYFGHSYTYAASTSSWVDFSGPATIGAGVGLAYSGNNLTINMGAGISILPSDEVGIDLYVSSGLMLTEDGTTTSTDTSAKLSLSKTGVSASTYQAVTVDVYGRITAGTNPTTLSGYGITDAVPLAGGTMTGLLVLSGAPTTGLHATTKTYVDNKIGADAVPLAGGTMTGLLVLSGAPTTGLHAATKTYVDGQISDMIGIAMAIG